MSEPLVLAGKLTQCPDARAIRIGKSEASSWPSQSRRPSSASKLWASRDRTDGLSGRIFTRAILGTIGTGNMFGIPRLLRSQKCTSGGFSCYRKI
jgi:hypothetical protein